MATTKRSSFIPWTPETESWAEIQAKKEMVKARLKEVRERQETASTAIEE
jgi:hypothetical protein